LRVVPDLCESIDYAEVQGVLFPRVAVSTPLSLALTCLLKLPILVALARFHENEGFDHQSCNAFDLPVHGENPRSDGADAEACSITVQDPDQGTGGDGMPACLSGALALIFTIGT
jgi:hypothetical protein